MPCHSRPGKEHEGKTVKEADLHHTWGTHNADGDTVMTPRNTRRRTDTWWLM